MAAPATEEFVCDWCGEMVDEEGVYSELNCRRQTCGRHVYHPTCVEDHLRKNKLAPDRLSGFPCPRGHGRQRRGEGLLTAVSEPCRGTIDSTHKKITKNKQKKAQPVYVPPPKPAPGPKKKVPLQQPLPAPPKLIAKPTPVRGGGGPSHAQAGAPEKTKAQMYAMVASLRKEISGVVPLKEQGTVVKPAAAAPARPAAPTLAAAAAIKVQPGAGAAARLGKQQQPVYIPGMEPADPVRRPSAKPFNLHEQKSAFPTLGQTVANNIIPGGAHPQKQTADPARSGEINALNPEHAKGFVTDLARYNALLGANAYEDMETISEEQAELVADDSFSYTEYEASSGSEVVAPEAWDPELTDHAVVQAYLHGMDAAGLPAEYAPLVQQLYDQFGDPSAEWEGPHDVGAAAVEQPEYAVYQDPQRVMEDVTGQMKAAEYAQIQYMQQQSLAGQWSVTPPAYTHVPSKDMNLLLATQQPVSLHSFPEAAKAAQLHAPPTSHAEADVDEDMFEDLLSLCLA